MTKVLKAWGLPVVWIHGSEPQPALTAAAETVPQVVHYHLHIEPGTDVSALRLALPPGSAVTTEEEE